MSVKLACAHCSLPFVIDEWNPQQAVACPRCTGLLQVVEPDQARSLDLGSRAIVAATALVLLVGGQIAAATWWVRSKPPVPQPGAGPAVVVGVAALSQRRISEPTTEAPPVTETVEAAPTVPVAAASEPANEVQAPVAAAMPIPSTAVKSEPIPPSRKRRSVLSDEDLRKQLLKAPELNVTVPADRPASRVGVVGRDNSTSPSSIEQLSSFFVRQKLQGQGAPQTSALLAQQPTLRGLPFRMGADCQLGKEPAETMQFLARKMRSVLMESTKNNDDRTDQRMNPEVIRGNIDVLLQKLDPHAESALPCLMQMLQPESTGVRLVLADQVHSVKHRQASEALAKLALYDLSDRVREKAVEALAKRPPEEYRHLLLEGFRYPWAPVADHAAEALVALKDREATPALKRLLAEPDPAAAYYDNKQQSYVQPEVVRINHLSNCMMCHAVSSDTTDPVRGRVPPPDQTLPPLTQYYENNTGIFVRADITYLKQDFSVYQPVESPGPWPQMQRHDYVVRRRPMTTQEYLQNRQATPAGSYPQREAVRFALSELSR